MTGLTVASFNVKNLIGADKEYYRFERYTPEEYAWKRAWLADQIVTLDADLIGFQEIFEEEALREVIAEADARGEAMNEDVIPDPSKRYSRKAIFRKLAYGPYGDAALAFAPNAMDGDPGARRPGLAVLSRTGFVGDPEVIQVLAEPVVIPFPALGGDGEAGSYTLRRTSRPILKVRVPFGDHVVTIFNCHLKSKLGEYLPGGAEPNLLDYDPVGRALGSLRAAASAGWPRLGFSGRAVVAELEADNPVIVMGDMNDGESAVSSEIIAGEVPFKNYAWMRRHDAERHNDRYTDDENTQIQHDVASMRLISAEKLFVRKSLRDMVYTTSFGGVFESIDQILLSRHFQPEWPDRIAEMDYFSALNDHLTDGSHPEAPYNKLASDHGQIMAHLRLRDD